MLPGEALGDELPGGEGGEELHNLEVGDPLHVRVKLQVNVLLGHHDSLCKYETGHTGQREEEGGEEGGGRRGGERGVLRSGEGGGRLTTTPVSSAEPQAANVERSGGQRAL